MIENSGIEPDEGDEWLRIGGVKLAVDGGFEGGLMREPYEEPWGEERTFRVLQTIDTERFIAVVRDLNRRDWRVATHAVGDAASDLVLNAYEKANAERSIVGRRWSIEHAFIGRPDQLPRMKALGLAISAQNHLSLAGPSLVKYWGATRGVLGAGQWISRQQALRLATINNAWLMMEERSKCSIEPRLRDTQVLLTMVGGKVVFQR